MGRGQQSVGVVLTLVGDQDTAVAAHNAKTDSAAVSVRVGRALIYMHSPETVETFVRAWQQLSSDAVRLPRDRRSKQVVPIRGMNEPAVVVDASGVPAWTGKLVQGRGQWGRLSLTIGRISFDIRDIPAFASAMLAFREAQLLVKETFFGPEVLPMPLRQRAVEDAAKAFHASGDARAIHLPHRTRGSAADALVQPKRPRLSQEWMR
jgi:hypothetical protein